MEQQNQKCTHFAIKKVVFLKLSDNYHGKFMWSAFIKSTAYADWT